MKKTNIITIAVILLLAANYSLFSQKRILNQERKKFELGITYQSFSASSYYNLSDSIYYNGREIVTLYDANGNKIKDTLVRYTHDFYRKTIGFNFKYNMNDRAEFSAYLPLSFYSLDEKYFRDYSGVKYTKSEKSRTRVDYLELGGLYKLTSQKILTSLIAKVRIPTGFEKGQILADPFAKNSGFLSDGAFELLAGTNFGFVGKKSSWINEVLYNFRTEDFKDQLLVNSKLIFSTVPNTQFAIFIASQVSMSNYENARPFIIREETLQSNSFNAGAEFELMINEDIISRVNYSIVLFGRNAWSGGVANIYLGYKF